MFDKTYTYFIGGVFHRFNARSSGEAWREAIEEFGPDGSLSEELERPCGELIQIFTGAFLESIELPSVDHAEQA